MSSPTNRYRGYYYGKKDESEDVCFAIHVYTRSPSDAKIAGDILARRPWTTPFRIEDSEE